jgi:signal transduction histidine kinase/ActR/RegA family two-component response regulator
MLGGVRVLFALGFERRYELVGERVIFEFNILTALQSLTLGMLAAVLIWHYWATQEVILTVVMSAGCIAAGTSALSVRRSAHIIFLVCVLAPLCIAVFFVGGLDKALLILGFLMLMAFLVQDGGQAKSAYFGHLEAHYDEKNKRRRAAIESQAKTEFLRDISHEIRGPINSVIGMTALLLDENLDNKSREYAETIYKNSSVLLNIVENTPGALKPQLDISESQLGSLDLRQCVNEVIGLYQHEASGKGLQIITQLEELPENVVSSAKNHLEQVLANLIANAVQFTEQGSVTVSAECKNPRDGSLKVRFTVTDTGVGIPAEQLDSVFYAFSQGSVNGSSKSGGCGLGLPLCKGLVKSMGGDIWIESSKGQGTTVRFTICVELDPSDTSWESTEDSLELAETELTETEFDRNLGRDHPHRILVVDDDEIHRQIVCVQLNKLGYQADEAADGDQAVAAVMQGNYDLIFMDLHMPQMNGIESSHWILERFNGDGSVRIIALTGDNTHEARERCISAGMDNFVSKPVQVKDLEVILRHGSADESGTAQVLH